MDKVRHGQKQKASKHDDVFAAENQEQTADELMKDTEAARSHSSQLNESTTIITSAKHEIGISIQ